MTDIVPYLQRLAGRFEEPSIRTALAGFTKSIQFVFSDSDESWLLRTVDGHQAILSQKSVLDPDITVTTTTEILAAVLDRRLGGAAACLQPR